MHATLRSYTLGFVASLLLTLLSFYLVISKPFAPQNLLYLIVSLALVQALFQLRFFLHLGSEAKPRWETAIFYFMVLVLLILAIGSLWIMYNLNSRMGHD